MSTELKAKSPFYPGQPVPIELFVGRMPEIGRILHRGSQQVAAGKPSHFFVQGEYGIGKSSIAAFTQRVAEKEHRLHPIYVQLGGAHSLEDAATAILEATIRSRAYDPTRGEILKEWLAKYIGQQTLIGFTLRMDALQKDAPTITSPAGLLRFLAETHARLKPTGVSGIFLVLDEINGIADNPHFAHMIKALVDENAVALEPLPLLLMLCGVEERRRHMIANHQPVERIFDIIDIGPMEDHDVHEFFSRSFSSVNMTVASKAMETLVHFSAGYPKIMHMIGDAAFWWDDDGNISEDDAFTAVLLAADDVGKKFVDQQVLKALRSDNYHSILRKIAETGVSMSFTKAEIAKTLTEKEKRTFGNFLRKMKELNVLKSGEVRGQYVFTNKMVRLYIYLNSKRKRSMRRK